MTLEWEPTSIKPIGEVLHRRRMEIDKKEVTSQLLSIHFDGTFSIREVDPKSTKGSLFEAKEGDLVFSKIDARNGAIGIVPRLANVAAFSSEFPIYSVDTETTHPEFLQATVRSSFFKKKINSLVSGTSGRKRVQTDDFESLQIPLPPLAVQQRIVERWRTVVAQAEALETQATQTEAQAQTEFLSGLGLQAPETKVKKRAFAASWSGAGRWGLNWNQQQPLLAALPQGIYPLTSFNEVLELVQYGTSEKANSVKQGTPILRIPNVKSGVLNTEDLKHISLSANEVKNLLLRDGDILIIRTSGSRDLVGTCAVFHEQGDYVYASYLIRLRLTSDVLPDFAAAFINSPLGRVQVDAVSRQIMQNNINSEEIRELRIPLPPLAVQQDLVDAGNAARQTATRVRAQAAAVREQARILLEESILGRDQSVLEEE